MDLIQFLTAFGLGAIITAFVQAWLTQRAEKTKRNFQEKKECYIGLLQAYRNVCLQSDPITRNEFAYWGVRCSLVASEDIQGMIEEMKTSDFQKQEQAFSRLQSAMRNDLGVQSK